MTEAACGHGTPDVVVTDTADGTAVAIAGDRIVWVGPQGDAPPCPRRWSAGGRLVTPGLVDCHTHLVFGGDRADEWERRLAGASFAELAAAGGGIRASVAATRAATDADLRASAGRRLRVLAAGGVTTVEVKSGYGLDLPTEVRMLRVARALAGDAPVDVVTTFLGAHAVPPEFEGDADGYVTAVCRQILPAVAAEGLADAVDAFCETVAFTPAQVARVFAAAAAHGLPVKLHADQLSDSGGAALAARHRAISADHLEHASADGIAALAASGTVAVLLPGATLCLREQSRPPVAALRAAGVPMAVATDANPGTSPVLSLLLAMHLACTLLGLTPAEALAGATVHGAAALGLRGEAGVLAPGARADLAVWDVERPVELVYWVGANPCHAVFKRGVPPPS
jgi:imidazolonepropionase